MINRLSKRTQTRVAVIDAIRQETFTKGTKLPSERNLCLQLGVSRVTLGNVLRELAAEGWLERRIGSGTYVAEELPAATLTTTSDQNSKIRNIGLIMGDFSTPVVSRLIEGIHRILSPDTCNLILKNPFADYRNEIRYVEHLISSGVDALVVMTSFPHNDPNGIRFYHSVCQRHPVIMTDCILRDGIPTVEVDNRRGGYLAADYLLHAKPHAERIWLVSGNDALSTISERKLGFSEIVNEHRQITLLKATNIDDVPQCQVAVTSMLKHGLPDAIFMTSELIIAPLLKILAENGIDHSSMALCCFDNFHSMASLHNIAYIEQPLIEVGMEVARHLILLNSSHPPTSARRLLLAPQLILPV